MGHGKLLTNSHKKAMNISIDGLWPRCASTGETILHVLHDCHGSHSLWTRLVSPSSWRVFFSLNLVDWIHWNHTYHANGTLGLDWKILFSTSCWFIWKRRNKLVFENTPTFVDDIYFSILNFARAVERSREELRISAHIQQRIMRFVGWQPPRTGGVKCNVDGSVRGVHQSMTCGGVIKDEAVAANELDLDSSTAIALLTSVVDDSHPCFSLIYRIKQFLELPWWLR
ncbi:ribonuclease H [Senna tora]|uniref:Ribonuclease H n=1 Tax=Senna tora TaxID=362788 RepID=A0A834XHM6_9FABA|nr:ribonuclease H [Senna tora]